MSSFRRTLNNSAALIAFTSMAALSSTAMADTGATAATDVSAETATEIGTEIVVMGFGETRQVQTITSADIAVLTPGVTPLKAIQKLPGVNFQSADAFGAYEWSSRISLRGFNQNQLGFTLDGVPLGDMSYGNYNGLHLSRAIISENTGSVAVSQGAGSLGTASTSNLGGTLQFTSRTPSDKMDLAGSITYGSEDTIRGFARIDSGDLGGVKGYISYGYLNAGKWKGDGRQRQHQVNAKVEADVGEGKITGFVNFSDRRENDYQDMSAEMINRLGRNWDNYAKDWQSAYRDGAVYQNQVAAAAGNPLPYPTYGTSFTAPVTSVDDAYYDAAGLRRDWLTGVTFETPVNEQIKLKVQGYYHNNHGQGLWWTPYVQSPSGAPISVRTTEYDIDRAGVISSIAHDTDSNHFEVGGWYESNQFLQARRFYGLDNVTTGSSLPSLEFKKDPFFTQWEYKFQTDTITYYVMDKLDLGSVTISGGWKGIKVDNKATPLVQGGFPAGTIKSEDMFLPQIGALARLSDNVEIFANYTENMRAQVSAVTSGPFSTTQAGFNAIKDTLKPETSKTAEIGGRFRSGTFQGSLAGYYVDFKDRLLTVASGASIVGAPSILQNVGSVRTYGFEAAGTWTPVRYLSLTTSYAYNSSKYQDDVLNADGTISAAIKDKTVVDSPNHIASAEIAYNGEMFFGRIGANYMSKRYYSYTNDVSVKGRVVADMSLGVKVPEGMGFMSGFAIEGSVTNLFDKDYVSTVGSGGYSNSGDRQTLLPGAPRQFYVTLRKGF